MKTFILVLFSALLSIGASADSGGPREEKNSGKSAIEREIVRHLRHLPEGTDGTVAYVEYQVREDGSLQILGLNGSDEALLSFIREQTAAMRLRPEEARAGEVFSFRLRFHPGR